MIVPVEVPPTRELPLTDTGPRSITPVPALVTVALLKMTDEGAVAVMPPVNAVVPAKVNEPVLEKVTALVIVQPEFKATL